MTPDPLPVALPELPTVAWLTCRSKDGKHVWEQGDSATNPDYVKAHPSFVWEPLVRKSDAEAALRAQAEEVAALRADAERWRAVPAFLEEFQINYTGLLRAVDDYRARLASKQEKP